MREQDPRPLAFGDRAPPRAVVERAAGRRDGERDVVAVRRAAPTASTAPGGGVVVSNRSPRAGVDPRPVDEHRQLVSHARERNPGSPGAVGGGDVLEVRQRR